MIPFVLYALFPLSLLSAQQSPHSLPNGYALPNGWTITPAGKSIPAHDMVLNLSMAPDGRSIIALQGGYNDEGLMVIDTATEALVQHLPLPTVWLGLAWHPDGKRLFVSGGNGTGTRRQPGVDGGKLSDTRLEMNETPPGPCYGLLGSSLCGEPRNQRRHWLRRGIRQRHRKADRAHSGRGKSLRNGHHRGRAHTLCFQLGQCLGECDRHRGHEGNSEDRRGPQSE